MTMTPAVIIFDRDLGEAVMPILVWLLLQIGLGVALGVSIWVRLFRAPDSVEAPTVRERLVMFAAGAYTISLLIAVIGQGYEFTNSMLVHRVGLAVALTALALALFSKGRARVITAISSAMLAVSWLPFALP